jgi:hypothetical protein
MTEDRYGRDMGDEATGALRDRPPDPLAPIDPHAPVSGHQPRPEPGVAAASLPEHDWEAARGSVFPILRPVGTPGAPADVPLDPTTAGTRAHTEPLISPGPCDLVVGFVIGGTGFDIMVNGDHLLSWGIDAEELAAAAGANLATWSASVGWSDETSGNRRLLGSDSGDGHDAARILLPPVRAWLTRELSGGAPAGTRVLVGLPERHLLIAGALLPDDADFVGLFRDFVVEASGNAEEPIDRRVFELAGGELVEFQA